MGILKEVSEMLGDLKRYMRDMKLVLEDMNTHTLVLLYVVFVYWQMRIARLRVYRGSVFLRYARVFADIRYGNADISVESYGGTWDTTE